ncbi:MAG: MBL fold metallo-hydrolase [Desulfobacterales bacterium]|nr:MBL fold metallo-hydrolase [Desulfobacterales bacterium]
MIENVLPGFFRLEIPLPESPLKFINAYVIKSAERNLIIDTGFNFPECLRAMRAGLQELQVDLDRTDFLITHAHSDHFGLVSRLVAKNRKVYINALERDMINRSGTWQTAIQYAIGSGFPENEIKALIALHPGRNGGYEDPPEMDAFNHGDHLIIGDYRFRCITTPGHTEGHNCLYDPDKRILVSGDHLLPDISPNIQCWSDEKNPLEKYLQSLDKIAGLTVDLVLPGHRGTFRNFLERIDELKAHHRDRSGEILTHLNREPLNAYQIASRMTWDIKSATWDGFPLMQKWFGTGETIAHLRFMEEEGRVCRKGNAHHMLYAGLEAAGS